jgi:thiol-disulfide isomerase/thioredoxin
MFKSYSFWVVAAALIVGGAWWLNSRRSAFNPGQSVPDFTLTLPDQSRVNRSDLKGKHVLVHFWGTWCGPCRAEMPEVERIVNTFQPKGLEIMSVAIELKDRKPFLLPWTYQTHDEGYFTGPLATLFNVKSIPAHFLIGPDGRMVASNPSLPVLEKLLSERLGAGLTPTLFQGEGF